jgi:hypothetical protein
MVSSQNKYSGRKVIANSSKQGRVSKITRKNSIPLVSKGARQHFILELTEIKTGLSR